MKSCLRCVVRGQVQGVAYRAGAQARARALRLTGWVRNLADGGVETLACGEAEALQAFCEWLRQGPRHASVVEVDCAAQPYEQHPEFSIRL